MCAVRFVSSLAYTVFMTLFTTALSIRGLINRIPHLSHKEHNKIQHALHGNGRKERKEVLAKNAALLKQGEVLSDLQPGERVIDGTYMLRTGMLIGYDVEIIGLSSERGKDFNGKRGLAECHAANGRVGVRLEDSQETISLKPCNLVKAENRPVCWDHFPVYRDAGEPQIHIPFRDEEPHIDLTPFAEWAQAVDSDVADAESIVREMEAIWASSDEHSSEEGSDDDVFSGRPDSVISRDSEDGCKEFKCASSIGSSTEIPPPCSCGKPCRRFFAAKCSNASTCKFCHDESHRGAARSKRASR